jgi:enoyl-CoA hydratase/carnithine racemase
MKTATASTNMNQNRSAMVDASDPRGDSALVVRLPSTSATYPPPSPVNHPNLIAPNLKTPILTERRPGDGHAATWDRPSVANPNQEDLTMIELERSGSDGDVFVLDLGEGDLRFTPDFLARLGMLLDEVERADGPAALVTVARGKIWHNGLDLDHMATLGDGFVDYIDEVQRVFARFLTLPVPTVAAIQGHAFAGGAMLALAHDVRVMRADRGFLCLPEIDLGMTFTDAMAALISAKVAPPALHRIAVLGERLGGSAALELGVVDQVVEGEEAVLPAAIERAAALSGKARPNLVGLRQNFYADAITALAP